MALRTLICAPPSVSSHPEMLEGIDRSVADLQMLDRIAAGLVNLPAATYDVVLLLTDADGTSRESHQLLARNVMTKVVSALKAGGILKSQNGPLRGSEKTEAILAGLSESPDGMVKVEQEEVVSIPLKFGKKKTNGTNCAVNPDGSVPLNLNGKRDKPEPVKPAGVGFVDFSDDLDGPIITGEDDELIDEDDLITEEDMARPVIQRKHNTHQLREHLLIPHSTRVPTQSRKATTRMQRLHLRHEGEDRSGRRCKAIRSRQGTQHDEARRRRSGRAGLYGTRQSRQLRQLCSWRRLQMRWMPIHRPPSVQAWRGGSAAEQRCSTVVISF